MQIADCLDPLLAIRRPENIAANPAQSQTYQFYGLGLIFYVQNSIL